MFGPGYFDGGRLRAVEQESQRVQGLVGPIFLVGLGLLLLLNNLGILAWSIWEVIFRLWPVLLIIVGLDLILSRSSLGRTWRILGALLMLLVVLSAVTLGAALNVTGAAADSRVVPHVILGGGKMVSENVDQPLDDAQRADVDLDLGGRDHCASPERIRRVDRRYGELREEKLLQEFRVDGDTAYYSLRQDGVSAFSWDDRGRDDGRRWDLRLNPDIPMSLAINGGVGKINLDLARLKITDLEVKTGISKTDLTLPKTGAMRATIDGGISETRVLIPRGMAARIKVSRGIGKVNVTGNYLQDGRSINRPTTSARTG